MNTEIKRTKVKELLKSKDFDKKVHVKGWVRTKRGSKKIGFVALNDGSTIHNIQIVLDVPEFDNETIKQITTGACIGVKGTLVESKGSGQNIEIHAAEIEVYGASDPDSYPLQKKGHTLEFLREIAHLRFRTNTFGAVFRIRHTMAFAIHKYFNDNGFYYLHTPIITGSDAEGAGEMFRVSVLDDLTPPKTREGKIDYDKDFFGKMTKLTVSGQLEAELGALSLSEVYTFGPTFRAENSNTPRHLAEFWMIEPEMAFCDLFGNMELGETLIKHLISFALDHCSPDLDLFARFVDQGLMQTLDNIVSSEFERVPYQSAVDILAHSKKSFDFDVTYGADLQSEHERYLTEIHFKKPVVLYDYPKSIKPFYMRLNDDGETVGAMDILVPRIGELIGGSQREERLEILEKRMAEAGLSPANYWWYLDSRRYGTVPHSGFGLGFERLLMLITGVTNIRDVIPFPRTPGNIDF